MRERRNPYHAVFLACTAIACTSVAKGQVTALHVVSRPAPADVLPGYVVNDLFIDFEGQYTGSQMIVELTRGSIYQNALGGTGPPISAMISEVPTVEWDSFLANGGSTSETTIGDFFIGDLGKFTEEAIDEKWCPTGDNEILDQTGFMVARVTLSDDATGTFQYLGAADGVIGVVGFPPDGIVSRPIRNGFIIPEPSTGALLGTSIMGLYLLRRARS